VQTRKSAHVFRKWLIGCARWRRRPNRYARSTGCKLGSGWLRRPHCNAQGMSRGESQMRGSADSKLCRC
jgi:hypothetical protein